MPLLTRQVWVLTSKNLAINLRRQWLSTPLRAFVLPVLLVVLLVFSRNLLSPSAQFGIGVSHPVRDLSQALSIISGTRDRVVFVNNGFDNGDIENLIANVIRPLNVTDVEFKTLRSSGSLQAECQSTSQGSSRCIAAVIFHSSPSEGPGGIWNYTMRSDGALGLNVDVESDSNDAQLFVFPLQHAIDFAIAQHESGGAAEPTVYDYPFTSLTNEEREEKAHRRYMGNVISILAVAFYIALVGALYHLTGAMAAERESGMAQLLDVMMPNKRLWEPQAARLASYHLAFTFLYAPGWIAMGAILGAIAFTQTSIAMSIISDLLCGLSLTSFAILAGSCFKEAQLSGVTAVISSLVLAIIAQVAHDAPTWVAGMLAFLFPPSNYVYLIITIARWERAGLAANALRSPPGQGYSLPIFAFWIFAVLQMALYPLLAATVERLLFGTKSESRRIDTPDSPVAVRLINCTKTYRPSWVRRLLSRATGLADSTVTAVNNLSLEIYRGELTVLLGTNGSGKSTTLDAVAGMHSLDSGSISLSYTGCQGRSGHCPQKNVLWDELTVEEHAKIFDGIKRVSGKPSREDIRSLIKVCDLSAKVKTCSKDLSGGQKRKLQLVLMFSGDSTICCIDEVSSGVDPLSRRKLWDILLAEKDRRTIILTTHFLDEADVLADRIAIMSRGSLRAQGTSAELKQRMTHGYRVHVQHSAVASNQQGYEDIPHLDTDGDIVYFPGTPSETTLFLRRLEGNGVSEYEVSSPTLEEVFLNVAADTRHRPGTEGGRASHESSLPLVDVRFSKPLARTQELFSGRPTSLSRQCRIMFMKRLTIFRRNYAPYLVATILPVIAAGCATIFLKRVSPASCNPDVATLTGSSGSGSISPQSFRLITGPEDQLSAAARERIAGAPPGSVTYVKTLQDFNVEVSRQVGNLTPGGFFLGDSPTFAWRADGPLVYGHILQNLLDMMILNMTIASDYQPLDIPFSGNIGDLLIFVAIAGFSIAMYPAFLILYPTGERLRGIRSMQYSNGVAVTPLWLSYLVFDFLVTLIVASVSVIVFQAVTGVWYYLGYLFLTLLLYGVAATLFAYALSSRAKSQLGAFAFCAVIQCASFLVFFVAYLVTLTYANPAHQRATLTTTFYILGAVSPICNFARALYLALNMFGVTCRGRELAPYPAAMDVYGGPILYLCLQSLLLFAVVLLEDSGVEPKQWLRKPRKLRSSGQEVFELESASAPNRARSSSKNGLEVIGLTKQFKRHLAVDDVSFSVPKNECFALLGPNGAGKTTCISMIRGDILPSNPKSEVLVEGISAVRHRSRARHKLGVCPQIDPLDKMTVCEHLDFYARVRGVSDPAHNVNVVLDSLGLREFADRVASSLSGGNKRKLSLGIALMGNPSVLLLDEPSSGMDAASMRLMWRILSSVTPGRSLLLTTHSMEEADALATRAGIVSGEMLACGTIQDLRSRYADRYLVHLVHQDAPPASGAAMGEIRRWIHQQFPGARLQTNGAKSGQVRFELPRQFADNTTNVRPVTRQLASVFESIQMASTRLGIKYYSVSRMNLEQVFLGVLEAHNAHMDS